MTKETLMLMAIPSVIAIIFLIIIIAQFLIYNGRIIKLKLAIQSGDIDKKNNEYVVNRLEKWFGKYNLAFYLGGFGALVGAIVGEFFPSFLANGLYDSLGGSMSECFSSYRNGLALKYAIFGLIIGVVIGLLIIIAKKNSNENK